jgi:pyruvate-ferredoxin/flavodoxin oxidoreductase
MLALSYGNVYVARVALGASDTQTVRAFIEAEQYDGPSLIIAYSHCIAHGINMRTAMTNQKAAVDSGYWPLFRFNPSLSAKGESPFKLDSKPPKIKLPDYAYLETRYKMLTKSHPEEAKVLMELAQKDVDSKWKLYSDLNDDYEKMFIKTNGQ